jgi:hypothetical protein
VYSAGVSSPQMLSEHAAVAALAGMSKAPGPAEVLHEQATTQDVVSTVQKGQNMRRRPCIFVPIPATPCRPCARCKATNAS